jgi:hypothetical protein
MYAIVCSIMGPTISTAGDIRRSAVVANMFSWGSRTEHRTQCMELNSKLNFGIDL